jgi:hypothetical protein
MDIENKETAAGSFSVHDGMKKALKHTCSRAFIHLYYLLITFLPA